MEETNHFDYYPVGICTTGCVIRIDVSNQLFFRLQYNNLYHNWSVCGGDCLTYHSQAYADKLQADLVYFDFDYAITVFSSLLAKPQRKKAS